jgi:hypothetical protein
MIISLLLVAISVAGLSEVDFKNKQLAQRYFTPSRNAKSCWSSAITTRGTTTTTMTERSRTVWRNEYTGWTETESTWDINITSKCGTVIALPVGGWNIKRKFTYYGPLYKQMEGYLVTVKVKICAPNDAKPPNEWQCRRTVKNLAEAGMAIPRSAGKSGRLQPLKQLAESRFGAADVMVVYDDCENNELQFVLFNCRAKEANPYIRTMMFEGEIPCADGRNPQEEGHEN